MSLLNKQISISVHISSFE